LLGLSASGGAFVTTATASGLDTAVASGAPMTQPVDVLATDDGTTNDYGVFLGLNPSKSAKLLSYSTVVIDAQYFTKSQIAKIKQAGVTVYSYLNIGSIEKFRHGYSKFKHKTLGKYAGWPGEYWMSPALLSWRNFIYTEAKALVAKGIDGFFIDNTDVYAKYHKKAIFNGLVKIFNRLNKYNLPILVNGGDTFVKAAILKPAKPKAKITGVNQEEVFSRIASNGKFKTQTAADTKYYKSYLAKCAKAGLAVYLLEYVKTSNTALRAKINDYCAATGYVCYISSSRNLV